VISTIGCLFELAILALGILLLLLTGPLPAALLLLARFLAWVLALLAGILLAGVLVLTAHSGSPFI
jgi:hypothetical protein